jgi:hypothetical protein
MLIRFIQRIETKNGYAMLYVSEPDNDDLHFSIFESIRGDGMIPVTLHTKCYSMRTLREALRDLVPREIAPA